MRALADARARQLREQSGFANAGVYDPPSVNGTHVIYVLHDITQTEAYGGLPANPTIPATYTLWKRVAKPVGLFLALLAAPVAFFHYITEGPKTLPPSPHDEERGFGAPGPPSPLPSPGPDNQEAGSGRPGQPSPARGDQNAGFGPPRGGR
jgi:hypothetical protein